MSTLTAFLNGLGAGQLAVVIAAIAAACWTLGRVFTLVEVLVRGHAPADVDTDELVEVLDRIEDALGEHGHLAGCLGDVYGATDELDTSLKVLCEDLLPRARHRARVEDLLADLLAATRTTTLAVQALDDDEDFDPDGPFDQATAYAQLHAYTREPKAYGEAFGTGRVPAWSAQLDDRTDLARWQYRAAAFGAARGATPDVVVEDDPALAGTDDGIRSTRLHELAVEAAQLDADARGVNLAKDADAEADDIPPAAVDPFHGDPLTEDELARLRAELTGREES